MTTRYKDFQTLIEHKKNQIVFFIIVSTYRLQIDNILHHWFAIPTQYYNNKLIMNY